MHQPTDAHRRTALGCAAPVALMGRLTQSRPDLIYSLIYSFHCPEHDFPGCRTVTAALEQSVSDTHQRLVKTSCGSTPAENSPPSHQVDPAYFSVLASGKDTQNPAQWTWRKPSAAHPSVHVM